MPIRSLFLKYPNINIKFNTFIATNTFYNHFHNDIQTHHTSFFQLMAMKYLKL